MTRIVHREPTSVAAYESILASGYLDREHERVYRFVAENGPHTGPDLNMALGSNSAHKRPSELEEMGLFQVVGTKPSRASGKEGKVWDITLRSQPLPRLPAPAKKAPRKRLEELLKIYTATYSTNCDCSIHGRDRCLLHQSLDALSS